MPIGINHPITLRGVLVRFLFYSQSIDVSMHVAINNQYERSEVYAFANKCYWSTPLLLMGVY